MHKQSYKYKLLKLAIKKDPFAVMITGEKPIEVRQPSEWIKPRLINRDYDGVKFTNGYGTDKPWFIAEYQGYYISDRKWYIRYSNDLFLEILKGDYIICLGPVIDWGNLKEK